MSAMEMTFPFPGVAAPNGAAGGDLGETYPNPTVANIHGPLTHTGTTVGVYGKTPVSRPAAYTLTFSTNTRTLPSSTAANVSTAAALNVGILFAYASVGQAEAIPVAINALIADQKATKEVLRQVILDLQSEGFLQ